MIIKLKNLTFFLCFLCINGIVLSRDFNVKDFGAKADGKTDDAKAFEDTWNAACGSSGDSVILIPSGKYLLGHVKFVGPCKLTLSITMIVEGHLLAETNLDKYPIGDWIYFGWVYGLTITGNGTFDGQGSAIWHLNDCHKNQKCKLLPTNLKFINMVDTTITGITSFNSKNFNFGIVGCKRFNVKDIKVIAPEESPNTDGLHVERSSDVNIENATIKTGDDCISLGQGLSNVFISKVDCGPGHGISIGSLGKYPNEENVTGIIVRDCTFTSTLNAVRIKTWENSPSPSMVSNVTYENITLNDVVNPIIIDQVYCPHGGCSNEEPSKVEIRDVTFRNIKGNSSSENVVTLLCSKAFPCKNVKLEDIDIRSTSTKSPPKSICENIKLEYKGIENPPPCK